ncbi:hypothetical protein ACFZAD_24605 [Streptomyces iakyrus]|uniref:hypothetical protein n=1 Tax=Streptomyces iakyrus TaxID=68219 RepID=UPI0036EAAD98
MSKATSKEKKTEPAKRKVKFFVPSALKSVEATDVADAVKKANQKAKVGDGNR